MQIDSNFFLPVEEAFDFCGLGKIGDFDWKEFRSQQAARGRLLICIQHEISAGSVLIAGCASLINFAMIHPSHALRARQYIMRHLPPVPTGAITMLSQLSTVGQPVMELVRLHDFSTRMSMARMTSKANTSLEELAETWRALCLHALEMMETINTAIVENGYTDEPVTCGKYSVERLVFTAGHGGWPCINKEGHLEIDGWIERREIARKNMDDTCELIVDGVAWHANLIEISRFGAGISTCCELSQDQEVRVSSQSYGTIAANVVWTSESRTGLRFVRPLLSEQLCSNVKFQSRDSVSSNEVQ
jgi:hypothetical protein